MIEVNNRCLLFYSTSFSETESLNDPEDHWLARLLPLRIGHQSSFPSAWVLGMCILAWLFLKCGHWVSNSVTHICKVTHLLLDSSSNFLDLTVDHASCGRSRHRENIIPPHTETSNRMEYDEDNTETEPCKVFERNELEGITCGCVGEHHQCEFKGRDENRLLKRNLSGEDTRNMMDWHI